MCTLCESIEKLEKVVVGQACTIDSLQQELNEAHFYLEKMNPGVYAKARGGGNKHHDDADHVDDDDGHKHLHIVKPTKGTDGFPNLNLDKGNFTVIRSKADLENVNLPSGLKDALANLTDVLEDPNLDK